MSIPESVRQNCDRFAFRAPASPKEIASCETALGRRLPSDLRQWLADCAGGTGWVGVAYIDLWSPAEISTAHVALAVDDFFPGALLFGSDGGGCFLAYVCLDGSECIVVVPETLEQRFAVRCAGTIDEFMGLANPLHRMQ